MGKREREREKERYFKISKLQVDCFCLDSEILLWACYYILLLFTTLPTPVTAVICFSSRALSMVLKNPHKESFHSYIHFVCV
jgi:hypothetical protein